MLSGAVGDTGLKRGAGVSEHSERQFCGDSSLGGAVESFRALNGLESILLWNRTFCVLSTISRHQITIRGSSMRMINPVPPKSAAQTTVSITLSMCPTFSPQATAGGQADTPQSVDEVRSWGISRAVWVLRHGLTWRVSD